jgi:hypothetical protein
MESSFEGFEQTSSKVTNYVLAFWILPKYIGKDMEPTNSILPPPPQSRTEASLLLSATFCQTPSGRRLTGMRSQVDCCCP